MKKLLLLFPLLFAGHLCADTNALKESSNNTSQSPQWKMKHQSENKRFDANLVCSSAPSVGTFQECQLSIFTSNIKKITTGELSKKEDETDLIKNAKIMLEGGMPAHHHGLPTSPIVNWSSTENVYQIKGLKFSMPGDWFLRFHVKETESSPVDKVEFKFSI